jgi:hypothetical protein
MIPVCSSFSSCFHCHARRGFYKSPPQCVAAYRSAYQIQTCVTDALLPAGLAGICSHRGIEVVQAMEKPAADIDDSGGEPASTVVRLK